MLALKGFMKRPCTMSKIVLQTNIFFYIMKLGDRIVKI